MRPAWIIGSIAFLVSGCASYIPPGAKANLQNVGTADIQAAFAAQPTCPFPASIAIIRVQDPSYTNYNLQKHGGSYGTGRYTVILTKEAGEDLQVERVSKLQQVAGIATINRLLLPERLEGDEDIRVAASRVQADMVFLYTFDTSFFDGDLAKPLTVISLGLSPTRTISAVTVCSALLMDTRTGYIYSAYEATERAETLATSWGSSETADEARRNNEREAFKKIVDAVATSWPSLLVRYEQKGQEANR